MTKKALLFIFLFVSMSKFLAAQQNKQITAMHKFMQANADSTLVLEFTSNWYHAPAYYLLSKKGDTITCYTYKELKSPKAFKFLAPKKITKAIYEKNIYNIYNAPVDINIYFNPFEVEQGQVIKFWKDIMSLHPWGLNDDSIDGEGCPVVKRNDGVVELNDIYDGGGIKLYLITKDKIKVLDFYAPDFYVKICPGRKGRTNVLKLSELFKNTYKF